MKTVLVMAYHYPPENGTCSEKNTRIVKKFIESGYNVRVLTCNSQTKNTKEKNLEVYHTKNGRFHPEAQMCTEKNNTSSQGNTQAIKSRIKKYLSNAVIPDAVVDWIPKVKEYILENPSILDGVDLVYSISSPYSAHLISRYISKKVGIPYIMCYGDPWIYEPKRKRGPIRYRIEKKIEGMLIKDSAGISVITEWNRKRYIELYNIPEDKINTYLIGYEDSQETIEMKNIKTDGNHIFSMLYGGSLDPVHRNVEPFMRAMKNVSGTYVEIRNGDFPSVKDMIYKYGLQGKVEVKPLIPSSEYDKLQREFDALILFGNKTPFQIPGKVFTCIATGKTIVYIKNNVYKDDGTEEVLRKYGNVIVVQNEEQEIANVLNEFIQGNQQDFKYDSEQFKYQNTMQPLIEMAEAVLN